MPETFEEKLEEVKKSAKWLHCFTGQVDVKSISKDMNWLIEQIETLSKNNKGALNLLDESIKTSESLAGKIQRYEGALKEINRWDEMLYSPREMGNFAKGALGLPTTPLK